MDAVMKARGHSSADGGVVRLTLVGGIRQRQFAIDS
jgi:hypothetical protein